MDFKIINLEKYEAEVCLHRDINEQGEQCVNITSFIFNEDDDEYILETVVVLPNALTAQNFIDDYSESSAEDWLVDKADEQGINLL